MYMTKLLKATKAGAPNHCGRPAEVYAVTDAQKADSAARRKAQRDRRAKLRKGGN